MDKAKEQNMLIVEQRNRNNQKRRGGFQKRFDGRDGHGHHDGREGHRERDHRNHNSRGGGRRQNA